MTKEMKNIPTIRFKNFTDAWEQRKFQEITRRCSKMAMSTGKNPAVEYEDVVPESGLLNKNIKLKNIYKKGISFDKNKILYGKLRPYLHHWLNPQFKGVAVGDWWVLTPVNIDKGFLYRLIQTQKFDEVANQSSGSKMPRADWNLVSNTVFIVPQNITEQKEIGAFFSQLDYLITLHQRKFDQLKKLKSYFLQNMFPTKDEKIPQIRFKGFSGDWEEYTLKDVADFNPKFLLPNVFEYVDLGSVIGTEIISHRQEMKKTAPARAQRLAKKGDVFYQTVRPYQKNNCLFNGDANKPYVFSTGYAQMRPYGDSYFLLTIIQNDDFVNNVLGKCTGTSYPAINSNDLSKIEVMYPTTLQEQIIIGKYFNSIDSLITLEQHKISQLQLVKKFMLQNMFV